MHNAWLWKVVSWNSGTMINKIPQEPAVKDKKSKITSWGQDLGSLLGRLNRILSATGNEHTQGSAVNA